MARPKQDFYQLLDSFVGELYADGTAGRWKADKRLKAQERKLNRVDREAAAVKKTFEGLKAKKPA